MERYGQIELPDFMFSNLPCSVTHKGGDYYRNQNIQQNRAYKLNNPNFNLQKVMIEGSWIIHYLHHQDPVTKSVTYYFYDNYGNQFSCGWQHGGPPPHIFSTEIKEISTPMSYEEIDSFKSLLREHSQFLSTREIINIKRSSKIEPKVSEIESLKDMIKQQNEMIKDLYQIISNQQSVVENLNRLFG
jgi:hypothetical protein